MVCEEYKEALIEASVTGEELAPVVREHVAMCPSCAAELEQQGSLAAAIDGNIRRQMNAPVPAAILQRIEARVAQEEPRRSLNLRWVYACAALATAGALVLFALPRLRVKKANSPTAQVLQPAQLNSDHRPQMLPLILQPATREEIRRDRMRRHAAAVKQPEVLVPPEERIAMEHFVTDLHGSGEIALARAKRVTEQREQAIVPVDAPDIQIVALKVSPIRNTDVGSDR